MANNLQHLASQIVAKPGFTVVTKPQGHLEVSKNGVVTHARVIHNSLTDTITVGDGSGVKTGKADAWLTELK